MKPQSPPHPTQRARSVVRHPCGVVLRPARKPRTTAAALPFVVVNMAMTADGKIASANRRLSSFGSATDLRRLYALRATADAVLCGAATVQVEGTTLGAGGARYERARIRAGLARHNLRVVVSGSGRLSPTAAIFSRGAAPVIVLTTEQAGAARRRRLAAVADVVAVFGERRLELRPALIWLRRVWGVKRLVCEGGGRLNSTMFRAGLVDELRLTLCPLVMGGRVAPTLADGDGFTALAKAANGTLTSIMRRGDELFLVFDFKRGARRASV